MDGIQAELIYFMAAGSNRVTAFIKTSEIAQKGDAAKAI